MHKIDLKKEFKEFYKPPVGKPQLVTVPPLNYLMIDGKGSPGEQNKDYIYGIEALFSISYKTKFHLKKEANFEYTVMPLEGLWWADDMNDFVNGNKDNWYWTLMILQPSQVNSDIIEYSIREVRKKKPHLLFEQLRFETYHEGTSCQTMHIGPYSEEHENILKIHQKIKDTGGHFDGHIQKHHEIYLNDPRRTAPEKLKTIIRQPFI